MSDYETERSAEAEKRYARRLGSCLRLRREFDAGADWSRSRALRVARIVLTACSSTYPVSRIVDVIRKTMEVEYGDEL